MLQNKNAENKEIINDGKLKPSLMSRKQKTQSGITQHRTTFKSYRFINIPQINIYNYLYIALSHHLGTY